MTDQGDPGYVQLPADSTGKRLRVYSPGTDVYGSTDYSEAVVIADQDGRPVGVTGEKLHVDDDASVQLLGAVVERLDTLIAMMG